jgi:DNA-binding winged helix-turn-helix (wHTH) protein
MREVTTSTTDLTRTGGRTIVWGTLGIVVILMVTAVFLFLKLPDADAFNLQVEQIFLQNSNLTTQAEIKLLEILALSGTAFAETLSSYRVVIFVLLVFATALLIASLIFVMFLIILNRRMAQVEREGIQVSSLVISRVSRTVSMNDMEFKLTDAAIETLAILAEARMDGDILTGAEIEAIISGRKAADCDEAAGATRIKRLRDTLGNQLLSEVLIKNITRQGYVLAIDKDVIRML